MAERQCPKRARWLAGSKCSTAASQKPRSSPPRVDFDTPDGAHEADGPVRARRRRRSRGVLHAAVHLLTCCGLEQEEHGRQGPLQAADHQGGAQVRPGHRRRQDGAPPAPRASSARETFLIPTEPPAPHSRTAARARRRCALSASSRSRRSCSRRPFARCVSHARRTGSTRPLRRRRRSLFGARVGRWCCLTPPQLGGVK